MAVSIYWHDYEAFGSNPRADRASQFAGVRTDTDLDEIDEPLVIYCKPARDMLPHPQACLITGITPQLATARGLPEVEFVRQIHEQFSRSHTCVAGYNSIRFDDELTRQLLYRNFFDPYEREWKNGNSRWDIIDMLRLCYALRPEGISWPTNDDGNVSFRLEDLCTANGIRHEDAHDALSDVRATIALARLVKQHQPKLYSYAFELRSKSRIQAALDVSAFKPVLHVSSMYPARLGCIALVMPLAPHPVDNNGVLLYDLRVNPEPWLALSVEALHASLFTPKDQLSDEVQRLPVKVVHTNRCPIIAPVATLSDERARLFGIDKSIAAVHWQRLASAPGFIDRLCAAFAMPKDHQPHGDPDFLLYAGGFFSDADRRRLERVRSYSATELRTLFDSLCTDFTDPRLPEMLFRYRARNFPESLSLLEQERWRQFCGERLNRSSDTPGAGLSLQAFVDEIKSLREAGVDEDQNMILQALIEWSEDVSRWIGATQ
jgi:exodeoxyribonuclease I